MKSKQISTGKENAFPDDYNRKRIASVNEGDYSILDSISDYAKNVNRVFHNTINDIGEQYQDLYSSVSQRVSPPSIPQVFTGTQTNIHNNNTKSNVIGDVGNSHAEQVLAYENQNSNGVLYSQPRVGLFKFLPKPTNFVPRIQNKTSRTTSIDHVRSSLLPFIPPPQSPSNQRPFHLNVKGYQDDLNDDSDDEIPVFANEQERSNSSLNVQDSENDLEGKDFRKSPISDAEAASELAEGTMLALRDIILDEAVELHEALRFWTERYEQPYLSCLEAGPKGKALLMRMKPRHHDLF